MRHGRGCARCCDCCRACCRTCSISCCCASGGSFSVRRCAWLHRRWWRVWRGQRGGRERTRAAAGRNRRTGRAEHGMHCCVGPRHDRWSGGWHRLAPSPRESVAVSGGSVGRAEAEAKAVVAIRTFEQVARVDWQPACRAVSSGHSARHVTRLVGGCAQIGSVGKGSRRTSVPSRESLLCCSDRRRDGRCAPLLPP